MSQALDPVTQHHVDQAAEALADEFAGIFSQETIERYIGESVDLLGSAQDQRLRPRARAPVRARAAEGARPGRRHAREGAARGAVRLRAQRRRSQMAAGLVKLRSQGRIHVRSAGSAPADEINPAVVEAMEEIGVDMGEEFPKPLTDEVVRAADVVITMGCGDACPIYPGKKYEDWQLDDPAGQDLDDRARDPRRARRARADADRRAASRARRRRDELTSRCAARARAPARGRVRRHVRARLRRLRRDHGRREDARARPRRRRDHASGS